MRVCGQLNTLAALPLERDLVSIDRRLVEPWGWSRKGLAWDPGMSS